MSTPAPSVVNSGQYLLQSAPLPLHVHSRPLCGQQWSIAPPVCHIISSPSTCPLQPPLWSTVVSISSSLPLSLYMSTLDPSVVNSGQYLPQAVSLPLHVHSRPLCGQQWSVAPPVCHRMSTPSSCPLQPRLWSTVVSISSRLFLSLYMYTLDPSVVNSGQ